MKTLRATILVVSSALAFGSWTEKASAQQPSHQDILEVVDDVKSKVDRIPPAWSELLSPGIRFQLVMNGAAVLDRETGLVWERWAGDTNSNGIVDSSDWLNWTAALEHCARKTVGNRKGWRLPTIQELASLIDPTITNPSLPSGHPFLGAQAGVYWSASSQNPNVGNPPYSVDFINGHVTNGALTGTGATFVWCVRGGQSSIDPQ